MKTPAVKAFHYIKKISTCHRVHKKDLARALKAVKNISNNQFGLRTIFVELDTIPQGELESAIKGICCSAGVLLKQNSKIESRKISYLQIINSELKNIIQIRQSTSTSRLISLRMRQPKSIEDSKDEPSKIKLILDKSYDPSIREKSKSVEKFLRKQQVFFNAEISKEINFLLERIRAEKRLIQQLDSCMASPGRDPMPAGNKEILI